MPANDSIDTDVMPLFCSSSSPAWVGQEPGRAVQVPRKHAASKCFAPGPCGMRRAQESEQQEQLAHVLDREVHCEGFLHFHENDTVRVT